MSIPMYSHATLGTNDHARSRIFYEAVMATLGHPMAHSGKHFTAYGKRDGGMLWVVSPFDRAPAERGNGVHIAFLAPDRATVDAFHTAALANGGSDEGGPGLRPYYHPDYYGAYVRDPDGNKLQAVCHHKQED